MSLLFIKSHSILEMEDIVENSPNSNSVHADLENIRHELKTLIQTNLQIESVKKKKERELLAKKSELAAKNDELATKNEELTAKELELEAIRIELEALKDNQNHCVICSQVHGEYVVEALLCGHVYHQHCLRQWFVQSQGTNCPTCNRSSNIRCPGPITLYLAGRGSHRRPSTDSNPSGEHNMHGTANNGDPFLQPHHEESTSRELLITRLVCIVLSVVCCVLFNYWIEPESSKVKSANDEIYSLSHNNKVLSEKNTSLRIANYTICFLVIGLLVLFYSAFKNIRNTAVQTAPYHPPVPHRRHRQQLRINNWRDD